MKNLRWYSIFLLGALFFGNFYGMERIQHEAPLQVYFSPQDQAEITNKLYFLLDNAKKQLLIAVYWITDKKITEKIIAAKNRNVDVQVIIDESSIDKSDIVPQLFHSGIVPVICPSQPPYDAGIMHNKFVVVDSAKVFTGSANFTQAALSARATKSNFENVSIINSADIAQKFIDAFMRMKQEIFDFCVGIVADNSSQLPNWMYDTLPTMYQKDHLMKQSVGRLIGSLNLEGKRKVNDFFGIQPTQQIDPLTDRQLTLLRDKGLSDEEILGLSKKEASNLISELIRQERGIARVERNPYWEPATEKQRALLRNKGVAINDIARLSKEEASNWISKLIGR